MWNYRVVRTERQTKKEQYDIYQLYEVYYDDDGKIEGMTENAMQPYGESIEELKNDLQWMIEALREPVLDMEELEKQFEENPPWAELVAEIGDM